VAAGAPREAGENEAQAPCDALAGRAISGHETLSWKLRRQAAAEANN
jgi:hypothetical protein